MDMMISRVSFSADALLIGVFVTALPFQAILRIRVAIVDIRTNLIYQLHHDGLRIRIKNGLSLLNRLVVLLVLLHAGNLE